MLTIRLKIHITICNVKTWLTYPNKFYPMSRCKCFQLINCVALCQIFWAWACSRGGNKGTSPWKQQKQSHSAKKFVKTWLHRFLLRILDLSFRCTYSRFFPGRVQLNLPKWLLHKLNLPVSFSKHLIIIKLKPTTIGC